MISIRHKHINKSDTVVMYAFEMCVENHCEDIESVNELAELMLGATDENYHNFCDLTIAEKRQCIIRITMLIHMYKVGKEL